MPLGGIGTGSIAICGDGSLRQWQIHNQINHFAFLPNSFFAIWTKCSKGSSIARLLQSGELLRLKIPETPPTSSDHLIPLPLIKLLSRLPSVEATEFIGEYPVAELTYFDSMLPVDVSLEAFNPFVPLCPKDSGLPTIIFNFTVTNRSNQEVQSSIVSALQNAIGWDGITPIDETVCSNYGDNINKAYIRNGMKMLSMSSTRILEDDKHYGSMGLATFSHEAVLLPQWDNLDLFWSDFSVDGKFKTTSSSIPSPNGRTWNGAIAIPFSLLPGESKKITFFITWYFPNRCVNWSQQKFGIEDGLDVIRLGNYYNNWFHSAAEVSDYISDHFERLYANTLLARDTFFSTTLPFPLIDTVTSQMSIIRTPTCFWTEDGRFYGFEGCSGASTIDLQTIGGCCPLNCTHVWNYEISLSRLFPSLERTMREIEWDHQQAASGYLPHRVILPLDLPRLWDCPIGGPENPALDGLFGAILKSYREYKICGDINWLKSVWSSIKNAIYYIWTNHDPKRQGVIVGEQPNTYDISIYGINTFIGTLYLASLKVVEIIAYKFGDRALASQCNDIYLKGQLTLEEECWNGEYYIQKVDYERFPENNWGIGCHSDQLLGQWWAHILDLGYVLKPDHVHTALHSIFRYNFKRNFHSHKQHPRVFVNEDDQGLLVCTWPKGGRPKIPLKYSDEVWSGLEYEVSALLLYEGEVEYAIQLIEAVRNRHDGRRLNPWNDIECGDHYVRSLSSWSLLEAASGYKYDAGDSTIGFSPTFSQANFLTPFITKDGWGTFKQQIRDGEQTDSIHINYGSLKVKCIHLSPKVLVNNFSVMLDKKPIPSKLFTNRMGWAISLNEEVLIYKDQKLTVTLSTNKNQ